MPLWISWWNAMGLLRPAFSRLRTFRCSATAVAGLTVRIELLGVTSIVRALKLQARFYNKLLEHFHSRAVKLDRLFFFQAEDGIRDHCVTGVQTCALPI